MFLKNKTNEELLEMLEYEKQRFVRADAFRELVKSIAGSTTFPYAILDMFLALRDAIHYIDDEMVVRWVNPAALCLYSSSLGRKVELDEVIGRKCFEVIGRSAVCDGCLVVEALRTRRVAINRSMKNPADDSNSLEVIAIPFFNGVTGCFEIIRHRSKQEGICCDGIQPE